MPGEFDLSHKELVSLEIIHLIGEDVLGEGSEHHFDGASLTQLRDNQLLARYRHWCGADNLFTTEASVRT